MSGVPRWENLPDEDSSILESDGFGGYVELRDDGQWFWIVEVDAAGGGIQRVGTGWGSSDERARAAVEACMLKAGALTGHQCAELAKERAVDVSFLWNADADGLRHTAAWRNWRLVVLPDHGHGWCYAVNRDDEGAGATGVADSREQAMAAAGGAFLARLSGHARDDLARDAAAIPASLVSPADSSEPPNPAFEGSEPPESSGR